MLQSWEADAISAYVWALQRIMQVSCRHWLQRPLQPISTYTAIPYPLICDICDLVQVSCSGALPPPRHGHIISSNNENVHLFGGMDELGATSLQLFKLTATKSSMESCMGTFKAEWDELDSELPYNR